MDTYPKKLNKCPLVEAVFEIRFDSTVPEDAVFGIVYQSLKPIVNTTKPPITLPIVNLPSEIRRSDPNLRFQPHYQIKLDNWTISVGPKTLLFSNRSPYDGWDDYKKFIIKALEFIIPSGIISKVIRTGLRYINVIDGNLFKNTKIDFQIVETKLEAEETAIHTTMKVNNGYYINLQLNNNVLMSIDKDPVKRASVIDIDVAKDQILNLDTFKRNIDEILEESHSIERERFFSLLTEDFLTFLKSE